MVMAYYISVCVLSLICCMVFFWNKRNYYPVLYAMVFVVSIIPQFCYVLLAIANDVGEAVTINKFLYLGGSFLPLIGFMLVLSICQIKVPKIVRFIMFLFPSAIYGLSLTVGHWDMYYKSVDITHKNGVTVLVKEYGPLHALFYVQIIVFLIATIIVLLIGWLKKPNVSRRDLAIASFMQIFSIFAFFLGRLITKDIEWMALGNLVDEIGFLMIMNHIGLYRVEDMVISSIQSEGKVGYIAMDFDKRYLSSTDIAKKFLPEIAKNRTDAALENEELRDLFGKWIDEFSKDNLAIKHVYHRDKKIYVIHVGDLYDGKEIRGYLLVVTDDTERQEHLEDIERYNMSLNRELMAKAKLIKELQNAQKEVSSEEKNG